MLARNIQSILCIILFFYECIPIWSKFNHPFGGRSSHIVPLLRSTDSSPMENIRSATRGGAYTRGGSQAVTTVMPTSFTSGQLQIFNLLSGGLCGTIASCITNPLEVIKTQLQSSSTASSGGLSSASGSPSAIISQIMKADGVAGFWRGLPPTLVGIIPARSVYFYSYETTKKALAPRLKEGGVANSMIAGFAAGIAGNTLTNPIWVVKTRMQLLADASAGQRAYAGYRDAISTIARDEGLGGFYKGMTASYWGCAEGCLQFMFYERLKGKLLARHNHWRETQGLSPNKTLPKYMYFASAAISKCVASISVYPHEVARTRLREQARSGVFKYQGMWPTLSIIAKEEGRRGLYAGMGMHLCKVVPNSAIMFLSYEIVNGYLSKLKASDD